jgi:hypothetical protein
MKLRLFQGHVVTVEKVDGAKKGQPMMVIMEPDCHRPCMIMTPVEFERLTGRAAEEPFWESDIADDDTFTGTLPYDNECALIPSDDRPNRQIEQAKCQNGQFECNECARSPVDDRQ